MPRYKFTIAYDGTDFCGWQKQLPHAGAHVPAQLILPPPDESIRDLPKPFARDDAPVDELAGEADLRERVELRTVQSVLERAVCMICRQRVALLGASRTDAGVHAHGQVAAFSCSDAGGREGGWPTSRGTDALCRAINARLPADVLVRSAEVVDIGFDPIGHAVSKMYTYSIWTGHERPLWERRTALHIWHELDHVKMDEAAREFIGEHDFAAFAAAGHGRKTTVRTVHDCKVVRTSDQKLVIEISGNGFLWNMVRIISGTLVQVGNGKMSIEDVRLALAQGQREMAGPTLPPEGLRLEWVKYT